MTAWTKLRDDEGVIHGQRVGNHARNGLVTGHPYDRAARMASQTAREAEYDAFLPTVQRDAQARRSADRSAT
ncbi:MAG TPA: hypothetical protein VJT16_17555 [Streptosporangiaceae bacterium]|nr:hypothetical protein [Streptosporangiaceae bacterium]